MTILYDRALVLAKVETTFRTDAAPTAAADAILVGDPQYSLDINQLERQNVRTSLSPLPSTPGRKTASLTFTHEVRGSGTAGTAPRLGRLLQACGMEENDVSSAAETVTNIRRTAGTTGSALPFTAHRAYEGTTDQTVIIEFTSTGSLGAAMAKVTDSSGTQLVAAAIVDDGAAFDLVNNAQVIIATGTLGSPTTGDKYSIDLIAPRLDYTPISDLSDMKSVTLWTYYDGLLHKMKGCRGTFTFTCTGGEYGSFTFTFTGDYVAASDAALPSGVSYETQTPVQVELAQLTIDSVNTLAAASFGGDIGNDVQIRPSVNAAESYEGAIIVGREPTLTFDPEVVVEATHAFWEKFSDGSDLVFSARVGTVSGNIVEFIAPQLQYSGITYANRSGIRTYDVTCRLASDTGDDELKIAFK